MNRSHLRCLYTALRRENLRLLVAIMVFSFAASLQGVALEGTSTLSRPCCGFERQAGCRIWAIPFTVFT